MTLNMSYLFLLVAICLEVVGSVMLKLSNGFEHLPATVGIFVFYASSYYFFSQALKTIPVSTGYALWSGLGIVTNSVLGRLLWGDRLSLTNLLGMLAIMIGLYFLNAGSAADKVPADNG